MHPQVLSNFVLPFFTTLLARGLSGDEKARAVRAKRLLEANPGDPELLESGVLRTWFAFREVRVEPGVSLSHYWAAGWDVMHNSSWETVRSSSLGPEPLFILLFRPKNATLSLTWSLEDKKQTWAFPQWSHRYLPQGSPWNASGLLDVVRHLVGVRSGIADELLFYAYGALLVQSDLFGSIAFEVAPQGLVLTKDACATAQLRHVDPTMVSHVEVSRSTLRNVLRVYGHLRPQELRSSAMTESVVQSALRAHWPRVGPEPILLDPVALKTHFTAKFGGSSLHQPLSPSVQAYLALWDEISPLSGPPSGDFVERSTALWAAMTTNDQAALQSIRGR